MATKKMSTANFRNAMSDCIDRAKLAQNFTILTVRNKPAAVLVSVEFYEQALRDRARLESLEK